jgi:hypothetical protein
MGGVKGGSYPPSYLVLIHFYLTAFKGYLERR